VSRDPERDWSRIAPHAVHDTTSYAEWTKDQPSVSRHTPTGDAERVRAAGNYLVLTPDECVGRLKSGKGLHLKPLLSGLDPEIAWESLQLIKSDVLPRL
jgi:hypothetical protein